MPTFTINLEMSLLLEKETFSPD